MRFSLGISDSDFRLAGCGACCNGGNLFISSSLSNISRSSTKTLFAFRSTPAHRHDSRHLFHAAVCFLYQHFQIVSENICQQHKAPQKYLGSAAVVVMYPDQQNVTQLVQLVLSFVQAFLSMLLNASPRVENAPAQDDEESEDDSLESDTIYNLFNNNTAQVHTESARDTRVTIDAVRAGANPPPVPVSDCAQSLGPYRPPMHKSATAVTQYESDADEEEVNEMLQLLIGARDSLV
jgi:hypothetical protein